MKKIFVRLIALTMVLTLLGCQGATNAVDTELEQTQATVLQSIAETETLESESMLNLPVSTKTIAEMVQAPERMVYEFENPNVYSEVGIDAEIILPDVEYMDVVPFSLKHITEEQIKMLYENLFSEDAVYADSKVVEQCIDIFEKSKQEELERKKIFLEQNGMLDKSDEAQMRRYENSIKSIDYSIWAHETLLYFLNQMLTQDSPNFSLHTLENSFGKMDECNILLASAGDYVELMFVINDCVYFSKYHISTLNRAQSQESVSYGSMIEWTNVLTGRGNSDFEKIPSYPFGRFSTWNTSKYDDLHVGKYTATEAADNLNALLQSCGFDSYGVALACDQGYMNINLSDDMYTAEWLIKEGFLINLHTQHEDIFAMGDHPKYFRTQGVVYGTWFEDGWWCVEMDMSLEFGEPLSENVELLPFDRIAEIAKNLISNDLDNEETLSNLSTIPISEIKLEYAMVTDENELSGTIVPAWNFYRVIDMMPEGEYSYTSHEAYVSINAIDGSVIY